MNESAFLRLLLVSMQYLLAFAFPVFTFTISLDYYRRKSWTPASAKVTGFHTRKEFGQTAIYLEVVFKVNEEIISSKVPVNQNDLLKKYPKGMVINIFVHPSKPEKILLDSKVSPVVWGLMAIAGVCFVISIRQLTIEGWGFLKYPAIGVGLIGLKTLFEEFFSSK